MALFLLPLIIAATIWAMVHRYRDDKRALAAGVAAAVGASAGVALAFPEISDTLPTWALTVWGCAAILVTIVAIVYAEARLKQVGIQPGR